MKNSLRNVRAVLVMGLTWALVWAPVGPIVGQMVDPMETMDEPWLVVGMYPGFLCGVVFWTLLRIGGPHRLAELSLPGAAARGAASGLLLPALITLFIAVGGGAVNVAVAWTWALAAVAMSALLGALAACVSLALSRRWTNATYRAT